MADVHLLRVGSWFCFNSLLDSMQIKLLKILALLGAGDKPMSDNMYNVLGDVIKKNDTHTNIGHAILYEAICTITSIYPHPKLLETAAEITSRFLKVYLFVGHLNIDFTKPTCCFPAEEYLSLSIFKHQV